MKKPITKLYAWIARDAEGVEGVCSWYDEKIKGYRALIHPDRKRAEEWRPMAMKIYNEGQFPMRLVVFSFAQTLEKYP